MSRTPAQYRLDTVLGEPVEHWLLRERTAGRPWYQISAYLAAVTNHPVSAATLKRWLTVSDPAESIIGRE